MSFKVPKSLSARTLGGTSLHGLNEDGKHTYLLCIQISTSLAAISVVKLLALWRSLILLGSQKLYREFNELNFGYQANCPDLGNRTAIRVCNTTSLNGSGLVHSVASFFCLLGHTKQCRCKWVHLSSFRFRRLCIEIGCSFVPAAYLRSGTA